MPFMQTWNRAVLDYFFQKSPSLAQPGNLTLGLSLTTPTKEGTGITEPTAASYARVETTPATWQRVGDEVSNVAIVEFVEALTAWGTATHFVLYNGAVPVGFGALQFPVAIGQGIQPRFKIGQLVVEYIY